MTRWRVGVTNLDHRIARAIARRATPALERPSRVLTWCADEHFVLLIAAGFGWRHEWETLIYAERPTIL